MPPPFPLDPGYGLLHRGANIRYADGGVRKSRWTFIFKVLVERAADKSESRYRLAGLQSLSRRERNIVPSGCRTLVIPCNRGIVCLPSRRGGEIGRRARLRIWFRKD